MTYLVIQALATAIYKGNIMSLKLQPNMTQNAHDLQICEDYWAYDNKSNFIAHVEAVCRKHNISSHALFKEVAQCFAYLDDVRCDCCGYVCPVQNPADIPYFRSKPNWICEVCEYDMQQAYYSQ